MKQLAATVEEYFSWQEPELLEKLVAIQHTISKAIPEAEQTISYGMPAFKTSEVLVYYAATKKHIGYYPTASGVSEFKKELSGYATSKGTIQFPFDTPLPLGLIADIARFRAEEAKEKMKSKK